jgi:hypothetical protein
MRNYFNTPKDYRRNYLNEILGICASIALTSATVFIMMLALVALS